MIGRTVADVLISFGARDRVAGAGEAAVTPDPPERAAEAAVAAWDFAITAAREEGLAEGLARAAADGEAALKTLRDGFDAHLAAERSRWAHDEARVLVESVTTGFAEIETRIAACAARILRAFLAERLIDRATRELAEQLRILLAGADGKLVQVFGPEDLVAALSTRIEGGSAALDFRPGAAAEVRIVCDDTLVESRLSAWLARLTSAVE